MRRYSDSKDDMLSFRDATGIIRWSERRIKEGTLKMADIESGIEHLGLERRMKIGKLLWGTHGEKRLTPEEIMQRYEYSAPLINDVARKAYYYATHIPTTRHRVEILGDDEEREEFIDELPDEDFICDED